MNELLIISIKKQIIIAVIKLDPSTCLLLTMVAIFALTEDMILINRIDILTA